MPKNDKLRSKIIVSFKWKTLEQIVSIGVPFVFGIILARILNPSDFGMIGMLAIFISISQFLVDSGFSQALIQRNSINQDDYSTVFYFNLLMGLIVYLLLFLISPIISEFYNQPLLTDLIEVLAISVLINSVALVQKAKLIRELNFKDQAKISIFSVIIGGISGVYFAINGHGVWSLVYQILIRSSLSSVLLWYFGKWMPKIVLSLNSFNKSFSFGSHLLVSGLLNVIFDNLYIIVIGKLYSIKELGFYTRANQLSQIPASGVTSIFQGVMFPVLSQVQNNKELLRSYHRQGIKLSAFIIFPVMMGLIAISETLVIVLLTEKWTPMVPMMELLALGGLMYPIHALNLNLLKAKGRSDIFLKIEIIKKLLITISVILTFSYGIESMIIGYIVVSYVSFFINTYYAKQFINYGAIDQIKDLIPIFMLSLVMATCIYVIDNNIDGYLLSFTASAFFAPLIYFSLAYIFNISEVEMLTKYFLKRD